MKGYLLLHGFAGSPVDVAPITKMVQKTGLAFAPVLAGHGGEREKMKDVKWEEWLHSAEIALLSLQGKSDELCVIGFSMGALLAGLLAQRHDNINRMVLISPPMFPNPPELIGGVTRIIKEIRNPADTYFKEYFRRLFRSSVYSITQLHQLMKAVEPVYNELTLPTLVIQGEKDDIAHPRGARHIYQALPSSSKRLVMLPQSRHLVCSDGDLPQLLQEIQAFLGSIHPKTVT